MNIAVVDSGANLVGFLRLEYNPGSLKTKIHTIIITKFLVLVVNNLDKCLHYRMK